MQDKARISRARTLRDQSTEVERKLWSVLRNRQLGGLKFRRQVPIDRYFADFACVEARLVIELDGGQHADRSAEDAVRTRAIEACGWKVVRFWNNEVKENLEGAADTSCPDRPGGAVTPHPDTRQARVSPSPCGRGELAPERMVD
jgi:very-short-patch-repair endonuclease